VTKYFIHNGKETVFYCFSLSVGQFPYISNLHIYKNYNIHKIYFWYENGTKYFLALKLNTCGHTYVQEHILTENMFLDVLSTYEVDLIDLNIATYNAKPAYFFHAQVAGAIAAICSPAIYILIY